jgi:hypothetical protein
VGNPGFARTASSRDALLIAAESEGAAATVLDCKERYDRIAEITGRPTRWLAPASSLR